MSDETSFANDVVAGDRGGEVEADETEESLIEPGRDHFFDAFLTCDHPGVAAIATDLADRIEAISPPRQRARRQVDEKNHLALVAALAANIAYAVVAGYAPPLVAVPLRKPDRKRTRYERKGFRQLREVVSKLVEADVVDLSKSAERGSASTIEPEPELIAAIRSLDGLDLASFGHAEGEETIILARTTKDFVTLERESELVDYADTPDTIQFREEMARINAYLAAADIRYEGQRRDQNNRLLDPSPRTRFLHRTFSIPAPAKKRGQDLPPVTDADKRFDRGGRLYHRGIFWQGLGKDLRQHIRIDGEPTAYLDFSSMYLRLALLSVDVEPPAGDLYRRIAGIETEAHRDGIKKVLNAMLFRKGELMRLPRGTRDLLPEALRSAGAVGGAIKGAFPELAGVFGTRQGFELTFTESRILVAALLRLNGRGITALPIHDGMMVAASRADEAKALIDAVTLETVGFMLPLARK